MSEITDTFVENEETVVVAVDLNAAPELGGGIRRKPGGGISPN